MEIIIVVLLFAVTATSCDIILDSYKDEKAIKVPWNSLKKKVM